MEAKIYEESYYPSNLNMEINKRTVWTCNGIDFPTMEEAIEYRSKKVLEKISDDTYKYDFYKEIKPSQLKTFLNNFKQEILEFYANEQLKDK